MRRTTPLLALAVLAVAACDEVTAPPQTIIYELHTVVGDPLPYVISKDEKSEFRLMSMRYEFTGDQYEMFVRLETESANGIDVDEFEGDGTLSFSGDTIRLEFGDKGWLAEPRVALRNGDTLHGKLAHQYDAVFVRR